MIPIQHYLLLSAVLFFVGVYGFIARKNLLAILISVELMLNAVELNFSVFNRYLFPAHLEGMFFSLFGIAITAAETAIAIAIIINIYRNLNNVDVRHLDKLQG
ncbi:NADH-quinone oxidoreductase subunit K [Bacteroidia bacterium]|nr:NADH-quinone oxidoreductase subunit K [Bacteroidia bacterium]